MKKTFTRKEIVSKAVSEIKVYLNVADDYYSEFSNCRNNAMQLCWSLYKIGVVSSDKVNLLSGIVSSEFSKIYEKHGYK